MTTISEEEFYQISEEVRADALRRLSSRMETIQPGDLTVAMLSKQLGITRYHAQEVLTQYVEEEKYELIERRGGKGHIYRPIK